MLCNNRKRREKYKKHGIDNKKKLKTINKKTSNAAYFLIERIHYL